MLTKIQYILVHLKKGKMCDGENVTNPLIFFCEKVGFIARGWFILLLSSELG